MKQVALSEDQIRQQINVLTQKTSENAEMVYKANATLNKALNPEFFSGNSTKIVNAINQLALANAANEEALVSIANKVNELLLDTNNDANKAMWEETKELSGKDTTVGIINSILKGESVSQVLGVKAEDEGKVLTVSVDEFGKVNTVAKQIEEIVSAEKISYSNNDVPGVNNIKDAIDYLIEHQGEGGIVNPGSSSVEWDDIQNKPTLGSKMYIDEDQLVLVDKDDIIISAVDLVTDEDIDSLLED